jgi:hypothetical protein
MSRLIGVLRRALVALEATRLLGCRVALRSGKQASRKEEWLREFNEKSRSNDHEKKEITIMPRRRALVVAPVEPCWYGRAVKTQQCEDPHGALYHDTCNLGQAAFWGLCLDVR